MDSNSSNAAKAHPNAPRDLQSRLYREIGISAVAAALEVSTSLVDEATVLVPLTSAAPKAAVSKSDAYQSANAFKAA